MKQTYLFLAPGFEEIEALGTVDILRRAGMPVTTVAVADSIEVTGAHQITVKADVKISDAEIGEAEWLITPGGMPGASNLAANPILCKLLKDQAAKHGNIAAICASPAVVLAPLGLLKNRPATCYPGFEPACTAHGAHMRDKAVVRDRNLITANGPASTLRFALAIVSATCGETQAQEVGEGMLFYPQGNNHYFG